MNSYDNIPAVRRSELWEIRKSPAHYQWAVEHPSKETPALKFGTASHKFILEEEEFWKEYILEPEVDRRTKDGKAVWSQFVQERDREGKSSVSASDYATILEMNAAILENQTATALLKTGRHEVPIEWTESETGERCKCRPDVLTEYNGQKYIVDYKTTTSCETGAFERSCRYYGYKLQAAMYLDGVFAETLEQYRFAFVAQEKTPPYAVRVYFCDDGFIEEGMALFRDLIHIYHECREADYWPGYEDKELLGDE